VLGASLMQMGRPSEGIAELEAAAATAPEDPVLLAWLAHAKAVRGECSVARTILAGLDRLKGRLYVPSHHLALVHVGLDDRDGATALLERACDERDPALISLGLDPRFDPIRSHERFGALLEKLQL